MKKFKFTLHTVLRQEQRLEKTQLSELAAIRESLRQARTQREELTARILALGVSGGRGMSVDEFRQLSRYIGELSGQRVQLDGRIRSILEEERSLLARMAETRKKIRVLEKLREKQMEVYQKALLKEEERNLDEIMSSYMR